MNKSSCGITEDCGGLKENAPNGSGTIRSCELVGGSVSLWAWVLKSLLFGFPQYDCRLTSVSFNV